jgi:hypothetical protein
MLQDIYWNAATTFAALNANFGASPGIFGNMKFSTQPPPGIFRGLN